MNNTNQPKQARTTEPQRRKPLRAANCCAVNGDFYNGIEWLGAWLVDHAEGETITEELVQHLCIQAWKGHLKRHNGRGEPQRESEHGKR